MRTTVLAGPYELFELADKQSMVLLVTGYEVGEVVIHPRYLGAPSEKVVKCLRVRVDPRTKPVGPPYWDITSQTLIATLEPLIRSASEKSPIKVQITAYGVPPAKRYSVELV